MYPEKPSCGGIFIFNAECAPRRGHRSEYRPRRVEVEGSLTSIYSRIKKKTRYRELNFILIIRPKNVEYLQSQPAAEEGGGGPGGLRQRSGGQKGLPCPVEKC